MEFCECWRCTLSVANWVVRAIIVVTLWGGQAEAATTVRLLESGDGIELEYRSVSGSYKDVIPLYRAGNVRYFSAGVGIEEREADYPPFALKLVFTAGGKPYLTGVAVTIQDARSSNTVIIPQEQITGPWLFVDLPPGLYHITGMLNGRAMSLKGVKVVGGKTKTLLLSWSSEDHTKSVVRPK